jgi:hypothetical protein
MGKTEVSKRPGTTTQILYTPGDGGVVARGRGIDVAIDDVVEIVDEREVVEQENGSL